MTTAVYYHSTVVTATSDADLMSPAGVNGTASEEDPTAAPPPFHRSPILRFEAFISVLVPLVFGCVGLLGFVGNLLVILVVVSDRHMRSPTNILIVSLAAADILFILFCVPFTAYRYAMTDWPFGDVACRMYQYTTHVTAYASVYSLVLMSVDRYLAVVHPVSSIGYRTERNAVAVLAVLWTVICAANVPVWIECALIEYPYADEYRSECVNARIYEDLRRGSRRHGRVVHGCFFAFAYFVPLVSICVLYGLMLRKLLRGMLTGGSARGTETGTGQQQQPPQQQQASTNRVRSQRRVTRMVVVVVLIFALCWLPNQTVFLVQYFFSAPLTSALVLTQVAANCLAYVNSCVNPFLYAFLSENFRKSFGRMLSCHRIAFHGGRGLAMAAAAAGDLQLNNIRTTDPLTHISGVKNAGEGTPSDTA